MNKSHWNGLTLSKSQWGGFALAIWAVANTYLDIRRYGLDQGFYWWFCNLALVGVSAALLTECRSCLRFWFSIACFTQVFWMIDNTYRVIWGKNLFGLVEFMFQPGLPMDEYLLSHYHYFTLPLCLAGILTWTDLPCRSWILVLIFNPLIFGVSYFLFPKVQNINCIHEPCFPGLESLAGVPYSVGFFLFCLSMHLCIAYWLDRRLRNFSLSTKGQGHLRYALVGYFVFAIILLVVDMKYRMSLPRFECMNREYSAGSSARCRYTLDYLPNQMLLSYMARNLSPVIQSCQTYIDIPKAGSRTLLETIRLEAGEQRQLSTVIEYPKETVQAYIGMICQDS